MLLVQAVVAATPLAEARGGVGAVAHVEARNEAQHYAHAEANCAFCTVSSIHAPAPRPAETLRLFHLQRICCTAIRTEVAAPDGRLPYLSRAPPSLA
ncbi:MAG: hypothetical protein ABI877_09165 [Gemmatimonadaceae bacterium]